MLSNVHIYLEIGYWQCCLTSISISGRLPFYSWYLARCMFGVVVVLAVYHQGIDIVLASYV